MNELIYSQINEIKKSISHFMDLLSEYASSNGSDALSESEKIFFTFISKQILFLKYFNNCYPDFKLKVLISDYYNFIVSIIRNENRYLYLNERSIIEGYTRLIVGINVEQDHVTSGLIEQLKCNNYINPLSDTEYNLITSEYVTSCGFIHGSNLLSDDLSYYFKECTSNTPTLKNINAYFQRITKVIKIFNRMLISNYTEQIDTSFYLKKSILKYLIGEEDKNILIQLRK